jgi:hypothetical protein
MGDTFGRLTVLAPAPYEARFHACRGWLCRCQCGKEIATVSRNLVKGITRSCGCLRNEATGNRRRIHGRSRTREYGVWNKMKSRCLDSRRADYPRYGGRGITVCQPWRESFVAFMRDMGPCPPGFSIDRIDNYRGYEPGNCRWASMRTQNNNKRCNHKVTMNGRTRNLGQWIREFGLYPSLVYGRLNLGWTEQQALTTPVGGRRDVDS